MTRLSSRRKHNADRQNSLNAILLLILMIFAFIAVRYVLADGTFLGSETSPHSDEAPQKETLLAHGASYAEPRSIAIDSIAEAVPETGTFLAADLDTMTLHRYEDGVEQATYEVASYGDRENHWDASSTIYEVSYKHPSHFSSSDNVYIPYSMQLHGNTFIHGWPYHPSGEDVSKDHASGSIRLSTKNAKEVYESIDVGTEILVHQTHSSLDQADGAVNIDATVPLPETQARAYLVANVDTGQIYAEKNAYMSLPIASISKLMTALIAHETIDPDAEIRITERADQAPGNTGDLQAGETMLLSDLLYPLLLNSGNDAAFAIADHYGREYFSFLMNKKARSLGMAGTHFDEASGLSFLNVSTVSDLFTLTQHIHENNEDLFTITTEDQYNLSAQQTGTEGHTYRNIHPLRHTDGFIGGKNGYISASRDTLLSLFEREYGEKEHTIAVIVLGSPDDTADSLSLLSWLNEATQD